MIRRPFRHDATCALALSSLLFLNGCYQGEWKLEREVPVNSTSRLLPTRDIERWELEPTVTPYVVRLRGELSPRCRQAQFGSTKRIETGTFQREGGRYWKVAAISGAVVGGALTGIGGSAWIGRDGGTNGLYSMYGVGGLLTAGGVINCGLALQKGNKSRYILCGTLTGLGVSALTGAALQQNVFPKKEDLQMGSADVPQALTFAGLAVLGLAGASGILAATWGGKTQRTREIVKERDSLWDRRQGESACGPSRPLVGRTATLELIAEHVPGSGLGSEADPLKIRVAMNDEGSVAVDLRALRQALPSCGVLRVQVNPDTLYEQFPDNYVPPTAPMATLPSRPIHGQILPREGITLSGIEGRSHKTLAHVSVPGFGDDVIRGIEHVCNAELARSREAPSAAVAVAERPPVPAAPAAPPENAEPPPPRRHAQERAAEEGECSKAMREAVLQDCEHSCSKSLEVSACVFERKKCLIDAQYSQQKQREMDLCALNWEKCIFKAGVGPAAWTRCVDSCRKKHEPAECLEAGP